MNASEKQLFSTKIIKSRDEMYVCCFVYDVECDRPAFEAVAGFRDRMDIGAKVDTPENIIDVRFHSRRLSTLMVGDHSGRVDSSLDYEEEGVSLVHDIHFCYTTCKRTWR